MIARHLPCSPNLFTNESRADQREKLHDEDGGAGRGASSPFFCEMVFPASTSMKRPPEQAVVGLLRNPESARSCASPARSWRADAPGRIDALTAYHRTQRAFSFMRFLYCGLLLPLDFLWLSAHVSGSSGKEQGETAMTHMVEGSKGGRNSVLPLAVGIMSAFIIALMLLIGIVGKNTTPNTAQLTTEATR